MYIGTQDLLKQYDAYLLEHGYQIEELVNLASDALLNHFTQYNRFAILIGPGNNGADGYSLRYHRPIVIIVINVKRII